MFPLRPVCRRASVALGRRRHTTASSGSMWDEFMKYRMPAALGFLCIGTIASVRKVREAQQQSRLEQEHRGSFLADCPPGAFLRLAPLNWVSRCVGSVARTELPFSWMRSLVCGLYVRSYGVELGDAADPDVDSYASLSALFRRELRQGARRIEAAPGAVVSPVDGTLVHCGSVELGRSETACIEQVKGVSYQLGDLLGPNPDGLDVGGREGRRLHYCVLYLGPEEYHRVHAPAEIELTQRRYFHGGRLPLRTPYMNFPGIFLENTRVVVNGSWQEGFFAMGLIGALGIGDISLAFDEKLPEQAADAGLGSPWWSRVLGQREMREHMYPEEVRLAPGAELGAFGLGSAVVLVFEATDEFMFIPQVGTKVKVGMRIGSMKLDDRKERFTLPLSASAWPESRPNGAERCALLTRHVVFPWSRRLRPGPSTLRPGGSRRHRRRRRRRRRRAESLRASRFVFSPSCLPPHRKKPRSAASRMALSYRPSPRRRRCSPLGAVWDQGTLEGRSDAAGPERDRLWR